VRHGADDRSLSAEALTRPLIATLTEAVQKPSQQGANLCGAGASTVASWFCAASNRRGKKTDREGEQHKCPEGIDRYVYRTGHLSITQLITIGSGYELN
jgi:hypothetical protein